MIHPGVVDEVELAGGAGESEDVVEHEAEHRVALLGAKLRPLDGDGRTIDGRDLEAAAGQHDGVGPGAAADLQDRFRIQAILVEHAGQFGMGPPGIPRRRSLAVGSVPIGDSHVFRLRWLAHGYLTV